ncbi:hypothetical protein [Streptomyces sp. NPDC048106]|uniref:hypothetical protein n=1 Tax=Streptomyces sp. NPDC048106 TaxID=3155750 RepID=UPI0034548A65
MTSTSRFEAAGCHAARAVGGLAVLLALLTACGDAGASVENSPGSGTVGTSKPAATEPTPAEGAGRPSKVLLEEYGIAMPKGAEAIHYREVRPGSGGTLYLRMRIPGTTARQWLAQLGGDPSDLVRGWSPIDSYELEESGWHIPESASLSGIWIPVPESGPQTDKKIVIEKDASGEAQVYLVTNRE